MTRERVEIDLGVPDDRLRLTANEKAWIEFLRLISCDRDPPLTLKAVQALRCALGRPWVTVGPPGDRAGGE